MARYLRMTVLQNEIQSHQLYVTLAQTTFKRKELSRLVIPKIFIRHQRKSTHTFNNKNFKTEVEQTNFVPHLRWLNTVLAVSEYVICQLMAREGLQLTS